MRPEGERPRSYEPIIATSWTEVVTTRILVLLLSSSTGMMVNAFSFIDSRKNPFSQGISPSMLPMMLSPSLNLTKTRFDQGRVPVKDFFS